MRLGCTGPIHEATPPVLPAVIGKPNLGHRVVPGQEQEIPAVPHVVIQAGHAQPICAATDFIVAFEMPISRTASAIICRFTRGGRPTRLVNAGNPCSHCSRCSDHVVVAGLAKGPSSPFQGAQGQAIRTATGLPPTGSIFPAAALYLARKTQFPESCWSGPHEPLGPALLGCAFSASKAATSDFSLGLAPAFLIAVAMSWSWMQFRVAIP